MEYKLAPWGHQLDIIEKVEKEKIDKFALFLDMGTGKTKTLIEILRLKAYELGRVPKTLILCPVVVMENWKDEILMHSYFDVEIIEIVDGTTYPTGRKIKNPKKSLKIQQASSDRTIFIASTPTVSDKAGSVWEYLQKQNFEFLGIDESHQLKAYKGTRSKEVQKLSLSKNLKYRFILTGTPILQDALDLWSQFYILDPTILGANYFQFRAKYFYDKNAGMPSHIHFPDWVPKDDVYFQKMGYNPEEDLKRLSDTIYKHAVRVMKYQVLELPEFKTSKYPVAMEGEQLRMYNDFRDNLVTFLSSRTKTTKKKLEAEILAGGIDLKDIELPETMKADLAIVKIIRLQQLICGIFTNDEGEVTLVPTLRFEALKYILTGLAANPDNKIIIWSIFKPTYEQIAGLCEELGLKYVFLNGSQNKDEKREAEQAFNKDPEVKVIIANQGAGGTGVNLTAANYSVYYTRGFNLGHDLQSEARNYRGGQTRACERIDIYTPDTIDERVLERLAYKKKNAEDILSTQDFKSKEVRGLV